MDTALLASVGAGLAAQAAYIDNPALVTIGLGILLSALSGRVLSVLCRSPTCMTLFASFFILPKLFEHNDQIQHWFFLYSTELQKRAADFLHKP